MQPAGRRWFQWCVAAAGILAAARAAVAEVNDEAPQAPVGDAERCLRDAFPGTRTELPALLNCLGLASEAVEVGVQAGVHASAFLSAWRGRHLRLVDKWDPGAADASVAPNNNVLYVDIANVNGADVRKQHRVHCESRLADAIREGRAEILDMDSVAAASSIPDQSLDFVYLDARHDFAGVVADIQAWWPKVRAGGVFAGHDFVDGEFPEGDFFWVSALREVLQDLDGHVHVTQEKDRYPSFFVVKAPGIAALVPKPLPADRAVALARRMYTESSRYFALWRGAGDGLAGEEGFLAQCNDTCGADCAARIESFIPTRSAMSTLRPFSCKEDGTSGAEAACGQEMVLDFQTYRDVCLERCAVTCRQRRNLFAQFGKEAMTV